MHNFGYLFESRVCRVHVSHEACHIVFHAGGYLLFPQEIRALTDYSVLRRRIGRKLADALWRSVGAVFDGLTDGCSQRYPHLGYAQNPPWFTPKWGIQSVDRNGDIGQRAAIDSGLRDCFSAAESQDAVTPW